MDFFLKVKLHGMIEFAFFAVFLFTKGLIINSPSKHRLIVSPSLLYSTRQAICFLFTVYCNCLLGILFIVSNRGSTIIRQTEIILGLQLY